MDIFFQDPSEIPLPAAEVRIRELRAQPSPDGRKAAVYLEVDPFLQRPSADILITGEDGKVVADASIIESMTRKMEVTLHIRCMDPHGNFSVAATLYFTDPIPEPVEGDSRPPELPERHVTDQAQTTFTIPSS